ncbi:uncharacterized protein LOC108104803 [Drosophila eugracilis]|uniref:uncharacterized protein LOC108104803 n=1 Tax=Drosophila eugracilis TaxID=29029 RepID=UPI001BD94F13|nr:uncharacterized protein LOC108104803 [Drosophila eugracilis]
MDKEVVGKRSSGIASHIYPKRLPQMKAGPITDEMGFTLSERLALRQAWNLIRPFERRYGGDIFYGFLNDVYWGINKFKDNGKLNMKALHTHALRFFHFIGLLIEEKDPVVFQLMINENNLTHSRCKVGSDYIVNLADALVDYVLQVFHEISSPTLERGFRKIVEKLMSSTDQQPINTS